MKRFKNILFVKSEASNEKALLHAATLASHNRARLTLVETVENIPDLSGYGMSEKTAKSVKQDTLESYRNNLEQLARTHHDKVQIETLVIEGRPFLSIIQEVLRDGYDLVIKAAESDKGLVSRLFCTTDMHLLRKCPCPVWLVKPGHPEKVGLIVAAVDFDEQGIKGDNDVLNRQILEMAIMLAHREQSELHIVHAWKAIAENMYSSRRSGMSDQKVKDYVDEVRGERQYSLSQLMTEARDWVGTDVLDAVKPKTHVIKGKVQLIIEEKTRALGADLLVMGTLSRIGIPGFFIGNTAESILNRIDCSVLAVKPPGFVSPVVG